MILMIVILKVCCKKNHESKNDQETKTEFVSQEKTVSNEKSYDSLTKVILSFQTAVKQTPGDEKLIKDIINLSIDSSQGICYSVGYGVKNPSFPLSAQHEAMKRAAGLTAQQWALYLKRWSQDHHIPYGNEIAGMIRHTTVLYTFTRSDTLFSLFAVPLGSVCPKTP